MRVVVLKTQTIYPTDIPYSPSEHYPEYPFGSKNISKEHNITYAGVRDLLYYLGYDKENFGKKNWNPLGSFIKPGMTVVIKPNFVLSKHSEGKDIYSIITHPSVIRAIADYCIIALKGTGKIIIADAPQYNCDFNELIATTGLDRVVDFYSYQKGTEVELRDLRTYWAKTLHLPSCRRKLPGDSLGSVMVNIGEKSAYYTSPNPTKFYGAVYHRQETTRHHIGKRQEYEISRTILSSDVFISIPKLKVHKKVGVTLNGKGLVGITTNKNLIVHYTLGFPSEGGDQIPEDILTTLEKKIIKFERWMYDTFLAKNSVLWEIPHRIIYGFIYLKILKPLGLKVSEEKKLLDAGNWYGNDTAWRMVSDLMKIIHFADKSGTLQTTTQRKTFSIIDGIIGGENNGPLTPDPKNVGLLIAGENLLAVDLVATRLMGFDPLKLKKFRYMLNNDSSLYGLNNHENIEVISNDETLSNCMKDATNKFFGFKPHPGWLGHLEIN